MDWRGHSSKWRSVLAHFQKLCGNEGFSVTVSPLVSQVLWECSWELHPGQGLPASREQASPAGALQGLSERGCRAPTAPAPSVMGVISGAISASHSWGLPALTPTAFITNSSHTQSTMFLRWCLSNQCGSCQLLLCTGWGWEASRQCPALWNEGKGSLLQLLIHGLS